MDRPLHSCFDATREHTPGSGSGARSRATWWGATRVGYVRQVPDHRVTYDAFTPTLSAPPILTHYLAGQDGPIVSYTLTYHFQS